jgi:GntR family transcriptional regulator/MocR family aminotransferase
MLARELASASVSGVQRQLYRALRSAILEGRYPAGARLPSTRALAEEEGVARQTVVLVYQRLVDEGYVVSRVGAGTFVSAALPVPQPATRASGQAPAPSAAVPPRPRAAAPATPPPRSHWAERALLAPREPWLPERPEFDFRPGVPDWEAFPHARWRRLLSRRWKEAGHLPALGQYGDPAGYRPLRDALARYLAQSRGVRCTADQIVIVSGSQQGLDLLTRVCLDPGDLAAVEEPGYPAARAILSAAGARLRPVPIDDSGAVVEALPVEPHGTAPRVVYVTPSHQYPLGGTLPLSRRLALLEWAGRTGALVVEDDYDSELRYAGAPLPALQGLDEHERVAYIGSCSSVLFPPLRLGWVVAPPALVAPLVAAKWLADRQTSTLEQQVLADFIAAGSFTRHLRRSRALYGARRAALAAAVQRHLPPTCELAGAAAGLQTPLFLPDRTSEAAVVAAAAARGVGVYPLGQCYLPAPAVAQSPGGRSDLGRAVATIHNRRPHRPGLLLGFAAMREPTIEEGIRRLATALTARPDAAGTSLDQPG